MTVLNPPKMMALSLGRGEDEVDRENGKGESNGEGREEGQVAWAAVVKSKGKEKVKKVAVQRAVKKGKAKQDRFKNIAKRTPG